VVFKCRQLDDLFHALKTVKDLLHLMFSSFHHGLHVTVDMVSYAHVVYVT
jgi:hypothetical protein